MTKEKETTGEEEERGGLGTRKRMFVISGSSSHGDQLSLSGPTPKKACFSEQQDADYGSLSSPLIDEMEVVIMSRFPIAELGKVCLLNKRYLSLCKKGELFKIRRELGVRDLCVFMLATGDKNWWAFDRQFMSRKRLPELPADPCFIASDRETLCAGTHLIVSGREIDGPAVWRYELPVNRWFRGPLLNQPRCLFASATCGGDCAFVAGGIGTGSYKGVLNSAEKYNPDTKTWERLANMNEKRKLCSGIYMDGKFYVLGGQNERGESLACGEVFYEERNTWVKIPAILRDSPVASSESPPLLAVVSNNLYSIEASSNQLKVYMKESNSWKTLGLVPVITCSNRGWGVAFKSLGDELLVMGGMTTINYTGHGLAAFTCRPDPHTGDLQWKLLNGRHSQLSHFILNCSVMAA